VGRSRDLEAAYWQRRRWRAVVGGVFLVVLVIVAVLDRRTPNFRPALAGRVRRDRGAGVPFA
jgi:hypothetical protein